MNLLSVRLRELRRNNKMTQQQLADTLGCARGTVVSWESNKYIPDAGNISRLAQIFNVSSAYLMGYTDNANEERQWMPEEQMEKLKEEIDFSLAPTESEEQQAKISAIAVKIFSAQQLLTSASLMVDRLDLITPEDNLVLDWQLEFLEKHARTAREHLSSKSGIRPVFRQDIND